MVFGRGKPTVEGLENNEEIMYHWNKVRATHLKKKVNIVLTNKRLLWVDRDANQIIESDDIHDLQVVVTNVQMPSTKYSYTSEQIYGQIELWLKGEKIFWTGQRDPYGFRDKVQAIQRSNPPPISKLSSDEVTITRGSLPAGFSPTTSPLSSPKSSPKESKEDPLSILKIRFAKGEISKEEFEEMKEVLEQ